MANDFAGALRAANYEYKKSYVVGDDSTTQLEAARDVAASSFEPTGAAAAKTAMESKASTLAGLEAAVAGAVAEYSVAADAVAEVPESSEGAGDGTPAVPAVEGGELIGGYTFEERKLQDLKNELVSAQAKLVAYTKDENDNIVVRDGEYADAAAKTTAVDAAQAAVDAQIVVVDGAYGDVDTAAEALETEKAKEVTLAQLTATYRKARSNDAAVAAIGDIGEAEA